MQHANLFAALPLIVSGCVMATTGPATSAQTAIGTTALGQYHWHLLAATDAHGHRLNVFFAKPDNPLQLDFQAGQLRVSHTCNAMGSSYRLAHGTLQVDAIISTMMACSNAALNRQGRAIKAYLRQMLAVTITTASGHPTLTLTAPAGATLVFVGQPRTGH